jgi:hypothetical protein
VLCGLVKLEAWWAAEVRTGRAAEQISNDSGCNAPNE